MERPTTGTWSFHSETTSLRMLTGVPPVRSLTASNRWLATLTETVATTLPSRISRAVTGTFRFRAAQRLNAPSGRSPGTPTAWTHTLAGDFNGDGRDDLAGVDAGGEWTIGVSTGTQFLLSQWGSWTNTVNWSHILTGDFDGNGFDDIVGTNPVTRGWRVLLVDGQSFASATTWGYATPGWNNAQVADANRDGLDDLVGQNTTGTWYTGLSGGTGFTSQNWTQGANAQYFSSLTWTEAQHADLVDLHGKLDAALDEFEFVRNNVGLQLYAGVMKGSQATVETMEANNWEQAILLQERLTAAGISAELERGTIEVPVTTVAEWIGVTSDSAAIDAMFRARWIANFDYDTFDTQLEAARTPPPNNGPPPDVDFDDIIVTQNGTPHLHLHHVRVLAELPGNAGIGWQTFDPSWKLRDYQEGLPDLRDEIFGDDQGDLFAPGDFLNRYLAEAEPDELPYEYFERTVSGSPGHGIWGQVFSRCSSDGADYRADIRQAPGRSAGPELGFRDDAYL